MNNGMAGGHCEGFSMTALRFFSDNLDHRRLRRATPRPTSPIEGNEPLQGEIAEGFMYQVLPVRR